MSSATRELVALHANIRTPQPESGVEYMGEVQDLRWGDEASVSDEHVVPFTLPHEMGERAIAFFNHYLASPGTVFDRRYNCHTFTATIAGWLPVGHFDPNLVGWGGADILEGNDFSFVSPDDCAPGQVFGMVTEENPTHLVHSVTGIDSSRHLSVRDNASSMVIAETSVVMECYEKKLGQGAIRLALLDQKPRVIGTDRWKTLVEQRYSRKPYKGLAQVKKVERLIAAQS